MVMDLLKSITEARTKPLDVPDQLIASVPGVREASSIRDPKKRQLSIVNAVHDEMERQDLLATREETVAYFEECFHAKFDGAQSPEAYRRADQGITRMTKSGRPRIFMNPGFYNPYSGYKPGENIKSLVEEFMHAHQLLESSPLPYWLREIEVKDRLLALKDILGLDKPTIEAIRREKKQAVQNHEHGVPERRSRIVV